jgi:putative membrane protein
VKSAARRIFVNFLCLLAISVATPTIDYSGKIEILIAASAVLAVLNWLVKPILNLIFLPINLITLESFRWLTNVVILYLVTWLIPEFQIKPFLFPGLNFQGLVIPPIKFNTLFAFLLVAFLLNLLSDIIYAIFK